MYCPSCGESLKVSTTIEARGVTLTEAGNWCRCTKCGNPFFLRYYKDSEMTYLDIKMFMVRYNKSGALEV